VLTYSWRRCERGRTRKKCAAARDVSGSWVSVSTRRERREGGGACQSETREQ
jgi:hypothetical protein